MAIEEGEDAGALLLHAHGEPVEVHGAVALAGDLAGLVSHAREEGSACCPGAVAAALAYAQTVAPSHTPHLVTHYLSCDVQPATSFVGYGSVLL